MNVLESQLGIFGGLATVKVGATSINVTAYPFVVRPTNDAHMILGIRSEIIALTDLHQPGVLSGALAHGEPLGLETLV